MSWRNKSLFILLFSMLILLVGCSSESSQSNDEGSQNKTSQEASKSEPSSSSGGVLNIGLDAQPPTLDLHASGTIATRDVARLMYETLVTTNANNEAIPMLAESVETDDNQTFVFKLRQGILFHNGDEMKAEDVIASMKRWAERSTITGTIFEGATWEAEDDYTVVLTLARASALALDTMAATKMGAAIMPKEIIENAPDEGTTEYIGTGPFKLVEWKQDQYIKFEKFEDYQPLDSDPDGLGGRKEALVDEIYFHIASDTSTRLAGLHSGEYDFIFGVPYDSYEQIENDPNLKTYLTVNGVEVLKFNSVQGIGTNKELRHIINTGLDMDAAMMAAFPNKDLYWLHAGYMDESLVNWASDAGSEYHNINDQEKAKQMLSESSYQGEPFRIVSTRDYPHLYNVAVVVNEQLKELGIQSELEVYDWPTMNDILTNQPDQWDAFVISYSVVSTPPQFLGLDKSSAGGVNDDHIISLMTEVETAPTLEEAKKKWDELQLYSWKEALPIINFGSFHSLFASSAKVEGITTYSGPVFWNVRINE